jgi:hypothetical protein
MGSTEPDAAALREIARRFCAWCESEGRTSAEAVHDAIVDVVDAYRTCAALPPVPSEVSALARPGSSVTGNLGRRINAAIAAANAEKPELIPVAPIELRGLPRLYEHLSAFRDGLPGGSAPALRSGWARDWGSGVLLDAGALHDAFSLPVIPPTVEPALTADEVAALRAAAASFCAWCEATTELTAASVQALTEYVLDLYQRCARIPAGRPFEPTGELNVERPNPEVPEIDEHLNERLGFYPGGLGDLYDYAWALKNAPDLHDNLLFSAYNGWSDDWGGRALRECGRLHEGFPPPA